MDNDPDTHMEDTRNIVVLVNGESHVLALRFQTNDPVTSFGCRYDELEQ